MKEDKLFLFVAPDNFFSLFHVSYCGMDAN
jgi:hypothetical protein